jgi:hypothetical protein
MRNIFRETTDQILDRYDDNVGRTQRWQAKLQDAFRLVIPNRSDIIGANSDSIVGGARFERGEDRFKDIFDTTGPEAVQEFANNFQLTLMPPFERWANIEIVDDIQELPEAFAREFGKISDETLNDIKTQLDNNMEILFRYLNDSNFSQATNEALQEYAVGTGAVILNENEDFNDPLDFQSASITKIVFDEGPNGTIKNVWRNLHVQNRNIMLKWPNAELPDNVRNTINNNPGKFTDFIEASLYYPQNPEGFQYYYSIILKGERKEIFFEWRELNPWIVFRFTKSPDEILGNGPALTALPKIRMLIELMEFVVASAKFTAYPAYTAPSSNEMNPYMLRIEPGTIIPIGPEFAGSDIIRPIPQSNSRAVLNEYVMNAKQEIKDILFSNPLPPANQPSETATLTNARLQQWLQKNGGAISRFGVEFTKNVINSVAHILTKKGIIPLININGKRIPMTLNSRLLKLSLSNPLAKGKKQEEAAAIINAVQFAQQSFGGLEGLLTLDIGRFPEEYFDSINLPQRLINGDFKNSPLVQQIQNSIQQQPGQQQPQQAGPPGLVSPPAAVAQGIPAEGAPV